MQSEIFLQRIRNSAAQAAQKTCWPIKGSWDFAEGQALCVFHPADFVETQVRHPSNVLQPDGMLQELFSNLPAPETLSFTDPHGRHFYLQIRLA